MFIFAVIFIIALIVLLDGVLSLRDKWEKYHAWPKIHVGGLLVILCMLKFYVGE